MTTKSWDTMEGMPDPIDAEEPSFHGIGAACNCAGEARQPSPTNPLYCATCGRWRLRSELPPSPVERPTYEDLANVRAAIQVYARTMQAGNPFRASIERVEPWLKAEADRALEDACALELEREKAGQ